VFHATNLALDRDRDAHVLVLPSDHGVEDEHAWHHTLARAAEISQRSPGRLVLIGVEPQSDPDFGWIVPGLRAADGSHAVSAFVEKPDRLEASRLAKLGAFCSTFVIAAAGSVLRNLFDRHTPELVARHAGTCGFGMASPGRSLDRDDALQTYDFSRDLLQRAPQAVQVLPSPYCGWTDLGTPARLDGWLGRRRDATASAVAFDHALTAQTS